MPFPCYRLSSDDLVIEIGDVVDAHEEEAAERELRTVVTGSGARTVIVDVRTALVTAGLVDVLVRVHRAARDRGTVVCVVARRPLARRVFRVSRVSRTLLVAATLSGAAALSRGCRPAAKERDERGRNAGP
ncbi:anti-sigma factor antagonist [Streptomyces kanasensis]|uniref:anti-sigma factor antagonist n=1 Tax=Streptomyces kanasensis TaxID=936756 RepID=UPI0036FABB9F